MSPQHQGSFQPNSNYSRHTIVWFQFAMLEPKLEVGKDSQGPEGNHERPNVDSGSKNPLISSFSGGKPVERSNSKLLRIPRSAAQLYSMNVFTVRIGFICRADRKNYLLSIRSPPPRRRIALHWPCFCASFTFGRNVSGIIIQRCRYIQRHEASHAEREREG